MCGLFIITGLPTTSSAPAHRRLFSFARHTAKDACSQACKPAVWRLRLHPVGLHPCVRSADHSTHFRAATGFSRSPLLLPQTRIACASAPARELARSTSLGEGSETVPNPAKQSLPQLGWQGFIGFSQSFHGLICYTMGVPSFTHQK